MLAISANYQRGKLRYRCSTRVTTADPDDLVTLPDEFLHTKAHANFCPGLRSRIEQERIKHAPTWGIVWCNMAYRSPS